MKFAIYGAGAVGAFLGARLLEAGQDVSFIARGTNLEALRNSGLHVLSTVFGDSKYKVNATSSPADIGAVDYVLLTVKANSLIDIAPQVAPLQSERTTFVSTQNGLPWWYFHGVKESEEPIHCIDPTGIILRYLSPERVLGSIVYFSCSMSSPGVVDHTQGIRLPLGEPAGGRSERILKLSRTFSDAGIKAPIRNDIRHELWVKLLGNGALNPLSALTQKTVADLIDSSHGHDLLVTMMNEIREVASASGVQIGFSIDKRIQGARKAGSHRTSMLQDLLHGRQPEINALLGSVIELADRYHVKVPTLKAIHGAVQVLFEDSPSTVSPLTT